MAEIQIDDCPARNIGGGHCFHVKFVRVAVWRESAIHGSGHVCCWCGAERPLLATYAPVVEHGPHQPKAP